VKRRAAILALALLGGGTQLRADGPVLHEYVPEARDEEALALVDSGGRTEPAAIVYEGEVLPAPRSGMSRAGRSPMSAEPPGTSGQGSAFRPDRRTEFDGQLGYETVFSPSVAPFKRVTALGRVALSDDGTPVLRIGDRSAEAVEVRSATTPPPDSRPRDRFWGDVLLDFSEGERVRFPSVSPESRILSLRTEPSVSLRIEKDGRDNYYAVAEDPPEDGRVRVVFLTDAPRPYFNAEIPDAPSDALSDRLDPLPSRVQRSATRFARDLGVQRGDPLGRVLETLTQHFRSFEESARSPSDSGNIYLDLARAKKGVCRHRAYAFVITAQALGIPARFVYNEAHSWVEVQMPGVGWMRIDLGGAADGLRAEGDSDGPMYEPSEPDPLPRPQSYRDSYSQLQGRSGGAGGGRESSEGRTGRLGPGPGDGSSDPGGRSATGVEGDSPSGGADGDSLAGGAGGRLGSAATAAVGGPEEASRKPVVLRIERRRYEVFRGRSLTVSGRATEPDGPGIEGLRIEVLLSGETEVLLGVTVSREHGWFDGSFGVPPELTVGDYRLVVRTPGDAEHAPTMAQ
jgi:transglutaminase-like putative cysteine protease